MCALSLLLLDVGPEMSEKQVQPFEEMERRLGDGPDRSL